MVDEPETVFSPRTGMDGFKGQVGKKKAEVEGGVAEMADFEVDEPDFFSRDEEILGTEIAVNERQPRSIGFVDERGQDRRQIRVDCSQASVVGIETQGVEE